MKTNTETCSSLLGYIEQHVYIYTSLVVILEDEASVIVTLRDDILLRFKLISLINVSQLLVYITLLTYTQCALAIFVKHNFYAHIIVVNIACKRSYVF